MHMLPEILSHQHLSTASLSELGFRMIVADIMLFLLPDVLLTDSSNRLRVPNLLNEKPCAVSIVANGMFMQERMWQDTKNICNTDDHVIIRVPLVK